MCCWSSAKDIHLQQQKFAEGDEEHDINHYTNLQEQKLVRGIADENMETFRKEGFTSV